MTRQRRGRSAARPTTASGSTGPSGPACRLRRRAPARSLAGAPARPRRQERARRPTRAPCSSWPSSRTARSLVWASRSACSSWSLAAARGVRRPPGQEEGATGSRRAVSGWQGHHLRRRRHQRPPRGDRRSGPRPDGSTRPQTLMDRPAGQWIIAAWSGSPSSPTAPTTSVVGFTEKFAEAPRRRGQVRRDRARPTCCSARSATSPRASPSPSWVACSCTAAITHDAKKSGNLDQALHKVLTYPFGQVLLVAHRGRHRLLRAVLLRPGAAPVDVTSERTRHQSDVEVDVVVLGLGPGGEHVAIKLAQAGLDVVGIEDRLVGGECPYYGCVPSKMMIAAAHVVAAARTGPRLRRDRDGRARLVPGRPPDARRGHRRLGRHRRGQAPRGQRRPFRPRPRRAGRPRTRRASAARRTSPARAWCSTPAPRPAAPPIDGLEGTPYWTNRDAVTADRAARVAGRARRRRRSAASSPRSSPGSASRSPSSRWPTGWSRSRSPRPPRCWRRRSPTRASRCSPAPRIASVAHDDGGFTLRPRRPARCAPRSCWSPPGGTPTSTSSAWTPSGLPDDLEVVETDERMRAGERLWAIGDITGKGAFTHVSMYQAAVVVRDVLGEDGPWADYRAVPRVTFTAPGGRLGGPQREGRARRRPRRGGLDRRPRRPRLAGQGAGV